MPYDAHHGDLRRGGPSGGGTRQPQPLRAAPTGDAGCPPARSPRHGCGRPHPPARPPAAVTRCRARCSASGCAAGGGVKGDAPRSATGSAQLGSAEGSAAAARFPRPAWPYLLLLRLRACRRAEASRGLRVAARRAVAAVEVTWEGKGRAVRHGDTPDTPTAPRRPQVALLPSLLGPHRAGAAAARAGLAQPPGAGRSPWARPRLPPRGRASPALPPAPHRAAPPPSLPRASRHARRRRDRPVAPRSLYEAAPNGALSRRVPLRCAGGGRAARGMEAPDGSLGAV